jgi:nicotinate-nucleotide adenylyltransferase
MRTGLLGGTFDPIHVGHLDVARAALDVLSLDRVWLVPSRVPPHRARPHASASHRFAMTTLAAQEDDRLYASDLEMETAGPSYTTDTLDRLSGRGVRLDSTFFITGADAFRDIRTWRAFPELLNRCHFVVVSRAGVPASSMPDLLPELSDRMTRLPGQVPSRSSILLIDCETTEVSSTDVREAIASGARIETLVPASVARHIHRYDLYMPTTGLPRTPEDVQ